MQSILTGVVNPRNHVQQDARLSGSHGVKVIGILGPEMDNILEYSKWDIMNESFLVTAITHGTKLKPHTNIMYDQAGIGVLGVAAGRRK